MRVATHLNRTPAFVSSVGVPTPSRRHKQNLKHHTGLGQAIIKIKLCGQGDAKRFDFFFEKYSSNG